MNTIDKTNSRKVPGIMHPANLKMVVSRFVIVCIVAIMASVSFSNAASAQTRSLKLYYIHTKEKATITYKKNGRYVASGLKKINRFLRDWRRNEPTKMDPKLLDLVWEAYRKTGSRKHIHVVSAYRSPATNAMLRKTRGGQAKKSQHMLGKAMDFYIPGVPIKKLREIGFKLGGGGVGYYPRSGVPFVHFDTGNVRSWPRMSRKQLTRLFPRGGTAHLPSTGGPLPGYKQALARAKAGKRGGSTIVDDSKSKKRSGGLLAALFGGSDREEDEAETTKVAAAPRAAAKKLSKAAAAPKPADTPRTLLAALPRRSLPVPVAAPRARANNAVPVAVTPPAPVPVAPVVEPVVEVAAAPPPAPTYELPVPSRRPAVLIARAEPPINRRSAEELEEALRASNQNAGQTVEVAAAPAEPVSNGSAAIAAAIEADDQPVTTELAYALPIPTPAPTRPAIEVAALPTPAPLRPAAETPNISTTEIAYAPPSRTETPVVTTAPNTTVPSGKSGRVVKGTDDTQTAALDTENKTTPKYARPTAIDRVVAEAPKPSIIPAEQIDQSRFGAWTTANASLTNDGRAQGHPDFIQNATRAVPNVVYTAGFSKTPPPNTDRFSGNAVTFLAVAKFENGVGDGKGGRGEPLQLSVPN